MAVTSVLIESAEGGVSDEGYRDWTVTYKVITSDPNRVVTPGFRVSAVVHVPWGGHPSPVPGCYNRDHQAFIDYRDQSQTAAAFAGWRRQWVDSVRTPQDYQMLLGLERMHSLRLKHHVYSEPVDFGY